jgi:F-box domain
MKGRKKHKSKKSKFIFDVLPPDVCTLILEYLPILDLYILERTSRQFRNLVQYNTFLKYASSRKRVRYINPLLKGFYGVHHAWRHISWIITDPISSATVSSDRNNKPMCHKLADTGLFEQSAVHPPLQTLTLMMPADNNKSQIDVVAKDGMEFVRILDVFMVLEMYFARPTSIPFKVMFPEFCHDLDSEERSRLITNAELMGDTIFFEGLVWCQGTTFTIRLGS